MTTQYTMTNDRLFPALLTRGTRDGKVAYGFTPPDVVAMTFKAADRIALETRVITEEQWNKLQTLAQALDNITEPPKDTAFLFAMTRPEGETAGPPVMRNATVNPGKLMGAYTMAELASGGDPVRRARNMSHFRVLTPEVWETLPVWTAPTADNTEAAA